MKTKLTLFAILLCLTHFVNAQTLDSTSYKHHFGVIASPTLDHILEYNKELPVGLIYKRQIKPNAAFRSTLIGTSYSNTFSSSVPNSNIYSESTSFDVRLTGGFEWQQALSKRWELYYGMEAGPSYGRSTMEDKTRNGSYYYTENSTKTSYEYYGVVLRPFAGAAFRINKRLYVATETAILASYSRTKRKSTVSSYYESQEQNFEYSGINVGYKPLSNISILLQF